MQRVAFRFATLGKACGESDKAGHDPAAPHARTSTVLNASLSAADLPGDWRDALADEFAQPYMAALDSWLAAEHAAGRRLFPARDAWFHAFAATPLADVRVVILGQDPYHGEGQAHGLAFSVRPGVRPPPSLVNIYKELGSDLGLARPDHGHLERWARQGVLLLNTALTVEAGRAAAHRGRGWERFTDAVIAAVAARAEPVVFLLWGAHAQGKAALVRAAAPDGRHLVLTAPHPSPLSARTGFFGCRHFSKANAFLEARGRGTVDWSLDREAGVERA